MYVDVGEVGIHMIISLAGNIVYSQSRYLITLMIKIWIASPINGAREVNNKLQLQQR